MKAFWAGLVCFVLLVCVGGGNLRAQDPQAAAALAPLPPDGFVTLEQITKEFTQNPDAALQKYNGMRIKVYGRVGQVANSDDEDGDPLTVYLQLPNNPTPDVKCVFNDAGVPQGGTVVVQNNGQEADFYKHRRDVWQDELTPSEHAIDITGQMACIAGTFDNFIAGDIVLKECRRLRQAAIERLLAAHGSGE